MRLATDDERARLHETFAALCAIASPFGRERACADRLIAELRRLGLSVTEDGAGAQLGGDTGNLLVRAPGRGAGYVLLCAHMDTVEPQAPIEPLHDDGRWTNANAGILGADNKAAIAVMLEVLRRHLAEPFETGIELLLTVSEENALAGAKAFDVGSLAAGFGYVFDHATPIGEVIVASPTYYRLGAEFRGRAAHAGIRPEDGRSAVLAAARAIVAMPNGRLDAETTANVGNVRGGVGSTNVVPDRCTLLAETRSLDRGKVEATVTRMLDALQDAANESECDVDVTCERLFDGYRTKGTTPAVVAAEAALRRCGYAPTRIATGGGSDANVLETQGFSCVNLANGTEANHEPTERVSDAALEGMLDVALALMEEVGRT